MYELNRVEMLIRNADRTAKCCETWPLLPFQGFSYSRLSLVQIKGASQAHWGNRVVAVFQRPSTPHAACRTRRDSWVGGGYDCGRVCCMASRPSSAALST
jgi:hypothetical protein